ncbi:MAG: adenylosuccinate lyase [Thermoplasmata archaeon]
MIVCPLDYRYGRDKIKSIFSKENLVQKLLDVESALARAHAEVGNIPPEAAEVISRNADSDNVDWREVERVEKEETKHDIMALVKVMGRFCGDSERYIHLGATSNDVIDTANGLILKEAVEVIREDLVMLRNTLVKRAKEHRDTVMVGRTHAQHAVPITFGLKVAVYVKEIERYIERLDQLKERVAVGKMSGAVGTGAALGEHAQKIQQLVMEDLSLGTEEIASQVVGRDRYAELVCFAASLSGSLQKYSTEVRNLQRPEIMEAAEAFDVKKQVGSSTMAHKKNPIVAENICGLAKTIRGFVVPTLENIITWHERDLTNSSSERITLGHTLILLDDILVKTDKLFKNLEIFPENMKKNLELSQGLIMGEAVMIRLSEKGMSRQQAHELIRKASMEARAGDKRFKEILLEDDELMSLIDPEELESLMDPANYTGRSKELVDSLEPW